MHHTIVLDISIQLLILIITDGFIMVIQKISLAFDTAMQINPYFTVLKVTLLQDRMLHCKQQ